MEGTWGVTGMAGKPNYRFERLQRERAKAAKKAIIYGMLKNVGEAGD